MTRTTVRETTVEYDADGNIIKSVTTETTTEWAYSYVPVPQVLPTFGPYGPQWPQNPIIWGTWSSNLETYGPATTYTVN